MAEAKGVVMSSQMELQVRRGKKKGEKRRKRGKRKRRKKGKQRGAGKSEKGEEEG